MSLFRKKYLYNQDKPIFQTAAVKTYNCMNTQTKNNKLILVHHLANVPSVEPAPSILQPIQIPTVSEPYSVYPLVYCCSEIGKISETDAMYVIKCLLEANEQKPLYQVIAPQGICCSNTEGILPNHSPDLLTLATSLLDIPVSLSFVEKSVVSKNGYSVCRGIRDKKNVADLISSYGWKDIKKDKDLIKDDQFWVFRAKKKEEGPFREEYLLAWSAKFGLCRLKYIDLAKDGYEDEFYQDFVQKVKFYQSNDNSKIHTLQIFKYAKEPKGIKIFMELSNQGTFTDYIEKKHEAGLTLTQKTVVPLFEGFIKMMRLISEQKIKAIGGIHIKNTYVHNNKLYLGEPLLLTDKIEKKLKELKNGLDYYAPELKQITLPESLFKLDPQKMDIWSLGFLLYKSLTREVPMFDPLGKPLLDKDSLSLGMFDLITRCLSLSPGSRPPWNEINLKELQKSVVVEQYVEPNADREVIRLGSRREKKVVIEEKIITEQDSKKKDQYEEEKLMEEELEEKEERPVPIIISPRLQKIKLIVKIILVMLLYIFVFFRPFLGNSIDLLLTRSYYSTTSLHLIDNTYTRYSNTTILTDQPNFFIENDITFDDIHDTYNCIDDRLNPVYNPLYSLKSYIQGSEFLALLLAGWLIWMVICGVKVVSIWRGGISNRPPKTPKKYWLVYGFFQVSMASLLFAHFYIFQFFYFSGATPCLRIQYYNGVQPFFDSSLYLFLENQDDYMLKVFASLGLLSILVMISTCFYALAPKVDLKHFTTIPSLILRLVPYFLLFLLCRIGVFHLFGPTAINDQSDILPSVVTESAIGFFGIIPEMFVIICVLLELLLEIAFFYCEQKVAESDSLSKLFNIKQKKRINSVAEDEKLNDMSLNNASNQKLNIKGDYEY